MRKIFTFLILTAVTTSMLYGQQEAQFSQNMFNKLAYNPAYAGAKDAICATGFFRQQWAGLQDPEGNNVSPRTYLVSVHSPIRIFHGGLGLTVYSDEIGFEKNIGAKLSYSYHIHMGRGRLMIGAQVGFLDRSMDFSKFKLLDDGDPVFTSKGQESVFLTDFAGGLYYKIPNKFYAGVSAIKLSQANGSIGSTEIQNKTSYYLMSGYNFAVSGNSGLVINPSVLIKTDWFSAQYDISTLLIFNEKYWGGLSYRVEDAVAIIIGAQIKDFKIGYSYDVTTSKLSTAGSNGSHEVMIGYCFKIEVEKMRGTYKNARYL